MGGEPQPEKPPRENQIFTVKLAWWFVIIEFVFNKLGSFFLKAMFHGLLDWMTFWTPLIEQSKMVQFCSQARVGGRALKFSCPTGTFFCCWCKNKFLNFITLTLYGSCCGGNKKMKVFLDSFITFEDGSGQGEFEWFQAEVPGWVDMLYVLGILCSAFTARPMLAAWRAKKFIKRCKFSGYALHLDEIKYCEYSKIYYCGCGVFCGGKLDAYLDDHLMSQTMSDKIQVAASNLGIPGTG